MNLKTFFTFVVLCATTLTSYSEEVPIRWEPTTGDKPVYEVPVTADYDDSSGELALKFTESSTYTVEVYSEKALVYSARVTVDSYREVSVRVKSFDSELHTIVVTDSSGNRYEGDFFA